MDECSCKFLATCQTGYDNTIEMALRRELFHDVELATILRNHRAWIGGGSLVNILRGEPPKDYDIFVPTYDNESEQDIIRETFTRMGWTRRRGGDHSFVLTFAKGPIMLDFIQWPQRIGEVATILDRFDFHHTQIGYDVASGMVTTGPETLRCIADKALEVHFPTDSPRSTIKRIERFQKRGWTGPSTEQVIALGEEALKSSKDKAAYEKD